MQGILHSSAKPLARLSDAEWRRRESSPRPESFTDSFYHHILRSIVEEARE
jgi:hypothetical protein